MARSSPEEAILGDSGLFRREGFLRKGRTGEARLLRGGTQASSSIGFESMAPLKYLTWTVERGRYYREESIRKSKRLVSLKNPSSIRVKEKVDPTEKGKMDCDYKECFSEEKKVVPIGMRGLTNDPLTTIT